MLSKSIRNFKGCSYCGYINNIEPVYNKNNYQVGLRYSVKYYDNDNNIQETKPIFCPTSYQSEYNKIVSFVPNTLVLVYVESRNNNDFHIKIEQNDQRPSQGGFYE